MVILVEDQYDFDEFDLGFTAVDETELDIVKKKLEETTRAEDHIITTQNKLDSLFNAIQPLLQNLKKNPEKEYILWPNRIAKVDEFEDRLRKIYTS